MARAEMIALAGTEWIGEGELWLDERGDRALCSPCTASIDARSLRYTWSYEGKPQEGKLSFDGALRWSDSWHQPKEMECAQIAGAWGLLACAYTYGAGEGPDWGWRIVLAQRPSGELVLSMTNIAPWGEETRAVRMIMRPA